MDGNKFDVEAHFKTKIRLLWFFSTWWTEPTTLWAAILERSLSAIRISLMVLASVCQVIQLTKLSNLKGVSEVVELMTMTTSASYKSAFFLYHQKDFAVMLDMMRSSFLERPMLTKCQKHTNMSKFLQYASPIGYLYFITCSALIIFASFAAILIEESPKNIKLQHNCNPNLTLATCPTVDIDHNLNPALPIKLWLPFDYSSTPVFQIVCLVTILIMYDSCLIYAVQDIFFFTLLHAVSGQFQILEESLMNLGKCVNGPRQNKDTGKNLTAVENSEEENALQETLNKDLEIQLNDENTLIKMFGECVQRHIILLRLLRDFEKLMQSMIIVDFLHAISSLSFALMELSVMQTVIHTIKLFSYVAVCIGHQFMNNHFGEMVLQKQLNISRAVYSLPWEEYPKKLKKSIIFMQLRTERPVVINGFKMYFLCYKTFMEFMKAILSYYTVLRNLHLEN